METLKSVMKKAAVMKHQVVVTFKKAQRMGRIYQYRYITLNT